VTWYCYQFEVNSIQRWIFGSGKLRAIFRDDKLTFGNHPIGYNRDQPNRIPLQWGL